MYQPLNPYTTHAQRSVAAAMAILAKDEQPQFIVNLGVANLKKNIFLNEFFRRQFLLEWCQGSERWAIWSNLMNKLNKYDN